MPKTGDKVSKPGVYSSQCCSYEAALALGQDFPPCGNCGRPTQWTEFRGGERT